MTKKHYSFGEEESGKEHNVIDDSPAKGHYSFADDDSAKRRRKNSDEQEKRWAGKVGGRTQFGSGAFWHSKGDVKEEAEEILGGFCWENKYTSKDNYRLSLDTWEDIKEKAYTQGRLPGMHIELRDPNLDEPIRLVVISKKEFEGLVDDVDEYRMINYSTKFKSYKFEAGDWQELEEECYSNDKVPVLNLDLEKHDVKWAVMTESEFLMMR